MAIKITCINKDNGNHENPNVAITHLGWIEDGTSKKIVSTRLTIYNWIKDGGYAYVEKNGNKVKVVTAETAKGTKYVKTEADSTTVNNLLALPEC
jgi:hypothetical protein